MAWKIGDIETTPEGTFQLTVQDGQYKWVPHTAQSVRTLEDIYASDVPTLGPTGEIIKRPPAPAPSLLERAAGLGEAGLTAVTGATGGALGLLGGTLQGIGDEVMSGNYGSDIPEQRALEYAQALTYAPRTETGQDYVRELGQAVGPMQSLTSVMPQMSAINRSAQTYASLRKDSPFIYSSPTKKAIVKSLQEKTGDVRSAPYKLEKSIIRGTPKLAKDSGAKYAIKQGFDDGVVASIKGASKADKGKMTEMVNIMQKVKRDAKYSMRNRPTDVVGDSFTKRLDYIRKVNEKAGKSLDGVAKSLKRKQANYQGAADNFSQSLDDMGIKLVDDALDYVGSDIEGLKGPQNAINNVYARLAKVKDAYDLHRLKRFIDEQVTYGKSAEGLAGKTENVLKTLRRDIDTALDNTFGNYNKINTRYADTRNAIDLIQDIAGKKIDLAGPNAKSALGQLLRGIMSNNKSRVRLIDSIDEIQKISDKYGGKFSDDLMIQALFADELDRVFKPVARTSFQGQIVQGVESAKRAVESPKAAAIDKGASMLDKARGINEEGAFKAIRRLLREQ